MSHPNYANLVSQSWNITPGDAICKLEGVKEKSIMFNWDVFGNIFKRKRQLEGRIKEVHRQLDMVITSDLIQLEINLQQDYKEVLAQKEMLWFQKSREEWIKLGNKNIKFFHTQIKRRRNQIFGLFIDGNWGTDMTLLQNEAKKFFKKLFLF